MRTFIIRVLMHLLTVPLFCQETVQGFTIYNNQLEITEGFGAYMDFCLRPNTKNFDNGGGSHKYNSEFLKKYYGVSNIVYDPYQQSPENNHNALTEIAKHDFDTATSNSVLNVIDTEEGRHEHILLSCEALRDGGIAYFKVFPGTGTLARYEITIATNRIVRPHIPS